MKQTHTHSAVSTQPFATGQPSAASRLHGPLIASLSLCAWLFAASASVGEESVVARLVAEKSLSVRVTTVSYFAFVPEEEPQKPEINFALTLKNDTNRTLPGWEMSSANAMTATLYRVEANGEVELSVRQWNLVGGVYDDPPPGIIRRDAPIARIPPGASVQMGMNVILDEKSSPDDPRLLCGRNGRYKLVFRLLVNRAELAVCRFTVDGEPGRKRVEIEL